MSARRWSQRSPDPHSRFRVSACKLRPLPNMKSLRPITVCLRLLAILQILTGGIAVMPIAWIAAWHAWLGLGHLPDDPFLRYVVRGGAFVQGVIGILIWVIASDVVRYRPLVLTVGGIYLVSGPAFYIIDSTAGMPLFWCVVDGASCFTTGSVLLALMPRNSSRTEAVPAQTGAERCS